MINWLLDPLEIVRHIHFGSHNKCFMDFFSRSGDITELNAEAIVNNTNESLTDRNPLSEKIFTKAGQQIRDEIKNSIKSKLFSLVWFFSVVLEYMIFWSMNKIWWLCLVPTSTTRFASDVGYRIAKNLVGLYKEDNFHEQWHLIP